jgi:hypothetical protein
VSSLLSLSLEAELELEAAMEEGRPEGKETTMGSCVESGSWTWMDSCCVCLDGNVRHFAGSVDAADSDLNLTFLAEEGTRVSCGSSFLMVPVLEESEERRRFLSFLDFFLVLELNIISIAIYGWQSIL